MILPPRRRLQPLRFGELIARPLPLAIIKRVLTRRGLSVMYGAPNTGKSFLAQDMAMHVALGLDWNGHKTIQGGVFYIAAEGGDGLPTRLQAFMKFHGYTGNPPLFVLPQKIDLYSDETDVREIIEEINLLGDINLVIIDTLSRAIGGGNENGSEGMGAFIARCDAIREATGAHVAIIHHSGKDASRGSRGHSSLKGDVDTEIEVKEQEDIITVKVSKQRDGAKSDYTFKRHIVHLGVDADGDDITSCALEPIRIVAAKPTVPKAAMRTYQVITSLLDEEIKVRGGTASSMISIKQLVAFIQAQDFAKETKPDSIRRSVQRHLQVLEQEGFVHYDLERVCLTEEMMQSRSAGQDTPL